MRILGYITHDSYLITVFKMDDKFSIQFEKGLLVQTYKYRSGPNLNNLSDVKGMVARDYLTAVEKVFMQMDNTRMLFLPKVDENDLFDEII